jgi:hypothetical protein
VFSFYLLNQPFGSGTDRFAVAVGDPPQNIRVLPGSGQSSTSVVDVAYCPKSNDGSLKDPNCPNSRGQTFNATASKSYQFKGLYEVALYWENNLGIAANATYGYDTITLGWQGSGLPTLQHQLLSAVQVRKYYLGTLALNPRPVNFTDFNDPQESLLQSLKNSTNNTSPTPSITWSYTAGGYNQVPKAYGSLVIGGYDTTYFTPNNVSFTFDENISTDLMVSVLKITTNATNDPLLSSADKLVALIDTLIPEMWLPENVCQRFEKAFGITWDDKNNMYTLSDEAHQKNLNANPTVTITLGPSINSQETVDIVMPYWSLYQTAVSPRVTNDTLYFPLVRAANDTQYTLGRTFLQSAHISADYDRGKFNVSQALYPDSTVPPNIVSVLPPLELTSNSSTPNSGGAKNDKNNSKSLSIGAIIGIAVGAVIAIVGALIAAIVVYRKRQAKKKRESFDPRYDKAEMDANEPSAMFGPKHELANNESGRFEVDGDHAAKIELSATDGKPPEIDGSPAYPVYEMPAEDVILPELETPESKPADTNSLSATPTPLSGRRSTRSARSPSPLNTVNLSPTAHAQFSPPDGRVSPYSPEHVTSQHTPGSTQSQNQLSPPPREYFVSPVASPGPGRSPRRG